MDSILIDWPIVMSLAEWALPERHAPLGPFHSALGHAHFSRVKLPTLRCTTLHDKKLNGINSLTPTLFFNSCNSSLSLKL